MRSFARLYIYIMKINEAMIAKGILPGLGFSLTHQQLQIRFCSSPRGSHPFPFPSSVTLSTLYIVLFVDWSGSSSNVIHSWQSIRFIQIPVGRHVITSISSCKRHSEKGNGEKKTCQNPYRSRLDPVVGWFSCLLG